MKSLLLLMCGAICAVGADRVVFVGCDVSASAWSGGHDGPNQCDADFAKVLETMRPQESLFLWLISDLGLTAGAPAISFTYRKYDPFSDRRKEYDQAVNEKKAHARRTLDELMRRTKPSEGTDILGFFHNVSQVARSYPPSTAREAYLFTDGVHEAEANFRKMSLTDEQIKRFVEQEQKAGRLPTGLKGVQVTFITGAYVQDSRYYDSAKLLRVEAAWRSILPACGAAIKGYGPVLVIGNDR